MSQTIFKIIAVFLSLFILAEVNYPFLSPQGQLAIFAMLGLILVFLKHPLFPKRSNQSQPNTTNPEPVEEHATRYTLHATRIIDYILILITLIAFGYVLIQSEPLFRAFWIDNQPLGNRAGMEQLIDYIIGLLGLLLVLEATRRTVGLTLPLLSLAFLLYAAFGPAMPDWLFPHRGYPWERIVSQTFLHSQGVFGIALKVMFTYVFLFVLFGTLLERTGATDYIINFARNLFRNSAGGPAKVAVLSSGMMGSLSGSAVANTATTGTFTIPMMRSAGFEPETAGGIEAAASSGGALVPPIMGAGAYMMLEIVEPAVTYLEIIKAAIIPAILYYLTLLLIVHFRANLLSESNASQNESKIEPTSRAQGLVFLAAFIVLIFFLVLGYTPFRAVSISLATILIVAIFNKETRIGLRDVIRAMEKAAHGGIALIAAASCVGVIIGVVTLTGIGAKLPGVLLPLAQNNLLLALFLLMISTIILGMGLPSAVSYLLMATLVGPVLGDFGLIPLAAHFFIFYFAMMSMVTPPVALAAYTAAAIANSGIMQTGLAAFRFAVVGFALPYAFVLRPELLMLSTDTGSAALLPIIVNVAITIIGIIPLAAAVSGYLFNKLRFIERSILFAAGLVLILSPSTLSTLWLQAVTMMIIAFISILNWRKRLIRY